MRPTVIAQVLPKFLVEEEKGGGGGGEGKEEEARGQKWKSRGPLTAK